MTEIVFLCLVGLGIIIMITNVIRYWNFMKKMTEIFSEKKSLETIGVLGEILLICFLLGYIVIFFMKELHDLIIAGILSGGSIYVCIILTILFQMVDTILYQLNFDNITDLPNRRSLNVFETHEEVQSIAILDINDFKFINEKYGHAGGDVVLKTVANRLKKYPEYRASRIGADEFLLQFENDISRHPEIGSRIHRKLGEPIDYNGNVILITCSIGCASRVSNECLEDLITKADIAMYKAKEDHSQKFWVHYTDQLKVEIDARRELIESVDEAIREDLFEIIYQPQVLSGEKKLFGFEALCHFKDDRCLPERFIPLAEETEQIISIGRLVTQKVIGQMQAWKKEGFELPIIFINYSAVQLKDPGYCDFLAELLQKGKIPADRIKLEITEGIPIKQDRLADDFFKQTQKMGIELALDDFGTGYSSMAKIMEYPIRYVKLDRIVNEKYLQNGKELYVQYIVNFAHAMGREIVAEGVETEEQYVIAQRLGIDQIQGFYFSKPLTAEEALVWMKKK